MARFALEPPLTDVPFVLDMVDLDSAKWSALAGITAPPMRWIYNREVRCLSQFEIAAARRAFSTLVVNERERTALARLVGDARIDVVENGVDFESLKPPAPPAPGVDVVFCGVMNYQPNVEGALWLARKVWPLVLARRGDARLLLVGSDPTRDIRYLSNPDSRIEVTGRVDDVRPYLWRAALAAAPLRTARGIQNKVLEATAAGLPAVVTPMVADGLPAQVLPACSVADNAASFAAAIIELLDMSPASRRGRAQLARFSELTWETRLANLPGVLEQAVSAGSVGSSRPHRPGNRSDENA
jgi:glycosyltransferase involved in cell wall biosynthesis